MWNTPSLRASTSRISQRLRPRRKLRRQRRRAGPRLHRHGPRRQLHRLPLLRRDLLPRVGSDCCSRFNSAFGRSSDLQRLHPQREQLLLRRRLLRCSWCRATRCRSAATACRRTNGCTRGAVRRASCCCTTRNSSASGWSEAWRSDAPSYSWRSTKRCASCASGTARLSCRTASSSRSSSSPGRDHNSQRAETFGSAAKRAKISVVASTDAAGPRLPRAKTWCAAGYASCRRTGWRSSS